MHSSDWSVYLKATIISGYKIFMDYHNYLAGINFSVFVDPIFFFFFFIADKLHRDNMLHVHSFTS